MKRARRLRAVPFAVALLGAHALAPAQQLALRTYSTHDGLAHGRVNCVHQDQRGYLWFGTWEGLSRFDGRRFVSFGQRDGMPNAFVNCIAEDRDGALWVGTLGGGVARLLRTPDERGRTFASWHVSDEPRGDDVFWIGFDATGAMWIATALGLHQVTAIGAGLQSVRRVDFERREVAGLAGAEPLCFSTGVAVHVRAADARVIAIAAPDDIGAVVHAVSTRNGVLLACERALLLDPAGAARHVPVPLRDGERITAVTEDGDGDLWVGTGSGLLHRSGADWQRFGVEHGLPDGWIRTLFADRDHNLWIATHRGGLVRLADPTAAGFGVGEGFGDSNVARVVEGSDGRIYATSDSSGVYEVFADHVEHVPGGDRADFANVHVRFACDRNGDFWLGSDDGLWCCEGPALDLTRARALGRDDGLDPLAVCAEIHQTADGSIWFGSMDLAVHRLDRDSRRWQIATSLRPRGDATPCRVIADDPGGDGVLLASFDRLWRFAEGRCEPVRVAAAEPLRPRCIWRDRRGWTWIGTRFQGVVVDRPAGAGGPLHLDSTTGLSSDAVWSITEDRAGRVYIGTGRGICRVDAADGRLQAFGGGGLAGVVVNHLLCDRRGRLWAATSAGLTRFDLDRPERARAPPPVYLAAIKVDGRPVAVETNGAARYDGLRLSPSQRSLEVEFVGLQFHDERPLRYQHLLATVDGEWSAPTTANTVLYADLPAGAHRLLVRALDADGRTSATAAELSFIVDPPFWRSPWFVATMALAAAALGWLWHRARLRRAVLTERLRSQIAGDLHDEVGAGLAQIAILSEVARQRAEPGIAADLGEVAGLARGLREAMGDIVWALARGNDTLADLVQRLRHLCSRLLEVEGTAVHFDAPAAEALGRVVLTLEQRRQLWLWCREALTNVARHAEATAATVQFVLSGASLRIRIADDGVGFDGDATDAGHGLPSLRHRSERLGGHMRVTAAPGNGTEIELVVPLHRRQRPA